MNEPQTDPKASRPAAGPAISDVPAPQALLAALIALTFVMNTLGRGVSETFAVFLLPVEKGLEVSRDEIALAYSAYMLAYGCSAPIAGQFIDRLGARTTYGCGLASLGLGYLLAGFATTIGGYIACVGLLAGLGAATLGMVVASSLLSRWFTDRLGSVVSLPYAASGLGMLLLPPIAQILLDRFGWQTAHQILGLGVLALLPLLLVLPLKRMSDGSPAWRAQRRAQDMNQTTRWSIAQAVRTDAFWALFAVYFATSLAAYAVLPHSVAHLVEQGFSPLFAASVFGMTGLLSFVGIISIAWLSDRIGRRMAVTLSYLSTMLGIASLMLIVVMPHAAFVYGFILFFGLMQGARGPVLVALIAKIFSGGSVGAIFGTLSLAMGLGAACGSWFSGLLHDATGSYTASLALALCCSFTGLCLFWVIPSLYNERVDGADRSG